MDEQDVGQYEQSYTTTSKINPIDWLNSKLPFPSQPFVQLPRSDPSVPKPSQISSILPIPSFPSSFELSPNKTDAGKKDSLRWTIDRELLLLRQVRNLTFKSLHTKLFRFPPRNLSEPSTAQSRKNGLQTLFLNLTNSPSSLSPARLKTPGA